MNNAVIVSAVRTPVGKAPRGVFATTRPDELGALVLRAALDRAAAGDAARAAAIAAVVPMVVFAGIAQRFIVKGLSFGAVK